MRYRGKHRKPDTWDSGEHWLPHESMALLVEDYDYRGKRRNCTCYEKARRRGCPAHGDATDELAPGGEYVPNVHIEEAP